MTSIVGPGGPGTTPSFHDEGDGYDLFGLRPVALERATRIAGPLYEHYFRVTSVGVDQIPTSGPTILVANHGGALPVDAAILCLDVLRRTAPTRIPRPIVDRFVPLLPFVNTILARLGAVSGTRSNVSRLLERSELLAIFPEGAAAMAKPFRRRYQLQDWRVGHAELALRHGAAIVPVAIIGAEESWPTLARLPSFHLLGLPYLPLVATPLPLPVRYRIQYGAPMRFPRSEDNELAADDPAMVAEVAGQVRDAVAELLARGLERRRGGRG